MMKKYIVQIMLATFAFTYFFLVLLAYLSNGAPKEQWYVELGLAQLPGYLQKTYALPVKMALKPDSSKEQYLLWINGNTDNADHLGEITQVCGQDVFKKADYEPFISPFIMTKLLKMEQLTFNGKSYQVGVERYFKCIDLHFSHQAISLVELEALTLGEDYQISLKSEAFKQKLAQARADKVITYKELYDLDQLQWQLVQESQQYGRGSGQSLD